MTKDFTQRGICRAKKGLLFLRDCGAAATSQCHKCGRPVCQKHQVPGAEGVKCPDCVAQDQPEAAAGTGRPNVVTRTRHRNRYYSSFGYRPYYYGHSHFYSDRDYRTFDENTEAAAAMENAEGIMDEGGPDDFDDFDDFLES